MLFQPSKLVELGSINKTMTSPTLSGLPVKKKTQNNCLFITLFDNVALHYFFKWKIRCMVVLALT